MKKIPTLFKRNPEDMSKVTDEVHPDCQWVLDGEGVATRKYDGTCVMLDEDRKWWARREVKPGKTPPADFVHLNTDENTGKMMGWVPMSPQGFLHPLLDALGIKDTDPAAITEASLAKEPGTYELCGPKINGNPEGFDTHVLVRHSDAEVLKVGEYLDNPEDIAILVKNLTWEGIVWHHPDGRMAKLKVRDYR